MSTVHQYEYWDTRPAERGGQTVRSFHHLQGSCRDNKLGLMAFLEGSHGAATETITFCPNALKGFSGESLKSVRDKTYGNGERTLDDIRDKVLGINLLHELSHSELVLGKDEEDEDDFYGVLFLFYASGGAQLIVGSGYALLSGHQRCCLWMGVCD